MTEGIGTKEGSKTKAFISSIRQKAGYPTSTQNTRCSPAGTSTTNKTDVYGTGVTFSTFLLS